MSIGVTIPKGARIPVKLPPKPKKPCDMRVRPSRDGLVGMITHVTPEKREAVKSLSKRMGISVDDLLEEGADYILKKYGNPKVTK